MGTPIARTQSLNRLRNFNSHLMAQPLPVRDDVVLGHALRQLLRAEQLDTGNQLTVLDSSDGQILLDDEQPEYAQAQMSQSVTEQSRTKQLAVPDEAVEFPFITLDDDRSEVPWVM